MTDVERYHSSWFWTSWGDARLFHTSGAQVDWADVLAELYLNGLNIKNWGKKENILSSMDKIRGYRGKVEVVPTTRG